MADKARLQVKTNADPEAYEDVGYGAAGVPIPVNMEELPPTSGNNPAITLTRNGSGYITNIAKLIGGVTYNKVITRDGNNYITNISAWS